MHAFTRLNNRRSFGCFPSGIPPPLDYRKYFVARLGPVATHFCRTDLWCSYVGGFAKSLAYVKSYQAIINGRLSTRGLSFTAARRLVGVADCSDGRARQRIANSVARRNLGGTME